MRIFGLVTYWSVLLILSTAGVAAQAAAMPPPTLAQYVLHLDWLSLGVAALIALTGGAGRTAASLFKEGAPIKSALRETLKDGGVALFTGAVCFVLITAWGNAGTPLPAWLQATFIFVAGFARNRFLDWLDVSFGKALDLGYEVAANWVQRRAPGATPAPKE